MLAAAAFGVLCRLAFGLFEFAADRLFLLLADKPFGFLGFEFALDPGKFLAGAAVVFLRLMAAARGFLEFAQFGFSAGDLVGGLVQVVVEGFPSASNTQL